MAFINGDVERGLSTIIPVVKGRAGERQELHDGGFVAESGMVRRSISVLVLYLQLGLVPQQGANDLK